MRKQEISLCHLPATKRLNHYYNVNVQRMENVILGALKWLMHSVTHFCFFSFFLSCLFDLKEDSLLLRHSHKSQATDLTFISSMVNS
ncbi:hypothetical protein IGI04_011255 [Brassica rapa subsp. trilocularis]|uniref:Cyclin C-terminal domain-containing protein n=1 Tax=Brassica rapa subsp. trilocularis TaxID=1813537 RepID=A0ABQ7N2J3_BRACM|nr:hypothetical protein IGI04_011255 [Brassica rapa subsp. trilocularis]